MRLKWKFLWLAIPATMALFGTGCGGINASGSVSPATFLLRNEAPARTPAPATPPDISKQIALAK